MSEMDEPIYLYECQSCFRCVQECTKGIFLRVINPEYKKLGDDYWKPDIIHRTWYQAQTGKDSRYPEPVIRGPFRRQGFRFHVDGYVGNCQADPGRHPWAGIYQHYD